MARIFKTLCEDLEKFDLSTLHHTDMNSLTLKVEVDAGTKIEDAFRWAVELATKVGVCVEFSFNDVICTAYPNGDPETGISQWYDVYATKVKYKFASTH